MSKIVLRSEPNITIWMDGVDDVIAEFSLTDDFGGILPGTGDYISLIIGEEDDDTDYFRVIRRQARPLKKCWSLIVEPISGSGFEYKKMLFSDNEGDRT